MVDSGSVLTYRIAVNGLGYDYPILIKGSNRADDWSNSEATSDAIYYFTVDFLNTLPSRLPEKYLSEILSNPNNLLLLAHPEVSEFAHEIARKDASGGYPNDMQGLILRQSDWANLVTASEKVGIDQELLRQIYDFYFRNEESREPWYKQLDTILGILGVGVIGIVVFIWRLVLKKARKSAPSDVNVVANARGNSSLELNKPDAMRVNQKHQEATTVKKCSAAETHNRRLKKRKHKRS